MNKMYWFTNSYRKKEAKFQNNLPNEVKAKFPRVDCCCSRASEARAHSPHGRGYRLEAFSQSDVPSTTLDVGRRFVVAVFKITTYERCMSECWNRNGHLPCRRLRPNYRRDGSRYDLASIPCAFRLLNC